MRDALKFGRLLGEAAAATIDDPDALDAALRAWEQARDKDTISTYHWGNRESRPEPTSPLVRAVLGTFAGSEEPNLSDTFNRARSIESIINPARLALRASCRRHRKSIVAQFRAKCKRFPMEISARRHRLLTAFDRRSPPRPNAVGGVWDASATVLAPLMPTHQPKTTLSSTRRTRCTASGCVECTRLSEQQL
jgi:hypothetical protein